MSIREMLEKDKLSKPSYIKSHFLPILLFVLSIWDIRIELRLLFDYFTLTSLMFAIKDHTLAFTILFASPIVWSKYSFPRKLR